MPPVQRIRVNAWVAVSVDNYVARTDGSIDWIESRLTRPADLGISKFKDRMDAIILGRRTYEKIVDFKIWPFKKNLAVYVMSTRDILRFPKYIPKTVRHTRECPRHIIKRLDREGIDNVWVDGITTIRSFLREGCINDIVINRFPILLGSGVPLFTMCSGNGDDKDGDSDNGKDENKLGHAEIQLRMKHSKESEFGVVQTQYGVVLNKKK